MAYQSIGLGSSADDGTGDTLRVGGDKVNDNFVELYTLLGTGVALSSGISATSSVITLTAPTISGVVGGTQTSATITTLTSTTVNAGTLALAAGSVTDSSGAISFGNENLVTTGTFGAGNITVGTITSTGATIVLEGATADAYETTLTVTDPTADRTITFPNITGTVVTTGDTGTVSTTMVADNAVSLAKMAGLARGLIIYGDSSGDPAALAVGAAGTFLKHDGTDVSWGTSGTSWQAVVTSATTMVAGRGYFVNTTSSAFSMTLPSSATIGDEVHVIDYAGTFDNNTCTVARNSHKISGATSDLVVTTERAAFKLVYVDATQGWLLTEL